MARLSRFFFSKPEMPVLRALRGASVGVDIQYLARANLLLQALPVPGVEQVTVQSGEQSALVQIGKQENRKLFGEHVIW